MAGKKEAASTTEAAVAPAAPNEETVTAITIPKSAGAVTSLADVQTLMLEDADIELGFEKGDVAIPWLRVLQTNSPQVKKQNAKYVEDAEAGQLFNTATNGLYNLENEGVYLIPVHFNRQATLWQPRGEGGSSGGGFVSEIPVHSAEALLKVTVKSPKNKDLVPAASWEYLKTIPGINVAALTAIKQPMDLELVIAALYYVLIIRKDGSGVFEPAAFPLSSTQMKKSRTWNALIKNSRLPNPAGKGSYRPAMFAFCYKITTVPENNVHGDWMGVKIVQDQPLIKYVDGSPQEMFEGAANYYLAARDFQSLVAQGKVKTSAPDDDDGAAGGDAGGTEEEEEDLPF